MKIILLFRQWLSKEHVAKWYGDPDDWIEEVENRHSKFNWISHFIVELDRKAIGFCQYYDYSRSDETWHNNTDINGVYSIDYMIGEENYLGKGYGTDIILSLIEKVKSNTDAKKIIVQPENDNHASRNTLLSSNFVYDVENDIYYIEL